MKRGSPSHWNAALVFRSSKKVEDHWSNNRLAISSFSSGLMLLFSLSGSKIAFHCFEVRPFNLKLDADLRLFLIGVRNCGTV